MTDLSSTLSRLRHKVERAAVLPRDSFKPAFLEAMDVIEQQQAEIERLLQAVAAGGIKAGKLTAKVIDREQHLSAARSALAWYADRHNYDHEGRVITNGDAPRWQIHACDFGAKARAAFSSWTSALPIED